MVTTLLTTRSPDTTDNWFICDLGGVIPKNDMASMEHPLFTLSASADKKIRHYEHNGNSVTVIPSVLGMATMHDKDIIIYCTSQLMHGINQGMQPNRTVRLKAHDLLIATNRPRGGESYKRLEKAFSRLTGTLIESNIKTNGQRIRKKFHILESVETIYSSPTTNRMVEIEVTLSEWFYNSVMGKQVLTINPDYFKLRKPLERRIYEIARKHCGTQPNANWVIGIKNLHKKSGSISTTRKFRYFLNKMIKSNNLPDYSMGIQKDNIAFFYIGKEARYNAEPEELILSLKPQTIENAKRIIGTRYDVYALEDEWKEWTKNKGSQLKSPDGAFINFCKNRINVYQ